MTIDEPKEFHPDEPRQARASAVGKATGDDVSDLAGQLGLPKDQTQAAFDVVLAELEMGSQRGSTTEEALSQGAAGERFSVGDLLQAMGSGTSTSQEGKQKPDLTEFAKEELAKAVAKKLGIDPATAGPIVETLLEHVLGKQTPTKRRRKTPKSTPKRPASSTGSKRRKAKKPSASSASASAKPAAKKRRRRTSASSGTGSSAAASKPARRKRPSSSSSSKRKTSSSKRPASSSSTSKRKQVRRRSTTRSATETVVSE